MAEIEFSALSKQCLDRRIETMEKLAAEVDSWEKERNSAKATVRWRFDKSDAKKKLQRHYFNLQN